MSFEQKLWDCFARPKKGTPAACAALGGQADAVIEALTEALRAANARSETQRSSNADGSNEQRAIGEQK